MTLRQQLIGQLRQALHELEKPSDNDEIICFEVLETDFNFEVELLNGEIEE
jgi:hypothetical protein